MHTPENVKLPIDLQQLKEVADADGKMSIRTGAGRSLMAMISKEAEERSAYQTCTTHADIAALGG